MTARQRPAPTSAELAILRVLWRQGPSTVRDVHEALERSEQVGYTTVLKQLQVMLDKGLVQRNDDARAHVYVASVEQAETERRLLDDLRKRAFGGSTARLVMRALTDAPASADELREIRALLEEFTRKQKKEK